jgi:hypothetical protein
MTIQPPITAREDGTVPPPDDGPLMTFNSYEDAVRAVDALADAHFPVQHVTIVGRGVRTVEDVTGRFGPIRAIVSAASLGALIGLFFGLLFDWWGAVTPEVDWGWLALLGLAYGAIAGVVVAALMQAAGGRRDFSSVRTLDADHYELTLTGGGARAEAMGILHAAGLA